MTNPPTLRVDGSSLEIIKEGRVVEEHPLGVTSVQVHIDESVVEVMADDQLVGRYPLPDRSPPEDTDMTPIPVRESDSTDHTNVMFY